MSGHPSTPDPARRRFVIALSFPGEVRAHVAAIATFLAERFGRGRILYDQFHEAEFARPNLDVYLQGLYHDDTELNVVVLCEDYERKQWCGLESRAIRDLLKHRVQEIMFLRFDDATVSGVYSIDGYVDIKDRNYREVADLILQRWQLGTKSTAEDKRPGPVLKNQGKLPNGRTMMSDVHLTEGERIHVALEAEHEIDFAICTPAAYKRWRDNGKLNGCLHLARRAPNMAITLVAKATGIHHVMIINNTRRKNPIAYTLNITEQR
jgi:hypothetical protein